MSVIATDKITAKEYAFDGSFPLKREAFRQIEQDLLHLEALFTEIDKSEIASDKPRNYLTISDGTARYRVPIYYKNDSENDNIRRIGAWENSTAYGISKSLTEQADIFLVYTAVRREGLSPSPFEQVEKHFYYYDCGTLGQLQNISLSPELNAQAFDHRSAGIRWDNNGIPTYFSFDHKNGDRFEWNKNGELQIPFHSKTLAEAAA